MQLIECVPNFSEGRDKMIIQQIADAITSVAGVQLLHVDMGKAANRTVITFVGTPKAVVEAAHRAIQKASALIDMRQQEGEHPRIGATDVCPLIPLANITMDETVIYAQRLGKRVGEELAIPVYLYEAAATQPERKNLATIRKGEYEGLKAKLTSPNWQPDFGPSAFNAKAGATVIGARDFLIAYNVNLNTTNVRIANAIAFDVRAIGRVKKRRGRIVRDAQGKPLRQYGWCKSVKAIGWYIEEYGRAQVSMNLTNINETAVHTAFEACRRSAEQRGVTVTGSELIGLAPLRVFLEAGRYFLQKEGEPIDVSEEKLVEAAVAGLGLSDLAPFEPKKRIIEYLVLSFLSWSVGVMEF